MNLPFLGRTLSASPVVAVSLLSGRTIRGALVERGKNGLVLRAASVSDEDAARHITWTRMDGDVVIPNEQVEFYQTELDPTLLATPLG